MNPRPDDGAVRFSAWRGNTKYTAAVRRDGAVDVMQGDRVLGQAWLREGRLHGVPGAALVPEDVWEQLDEQLAGSPMLAAWTQREPVHARGLPEWGTATLCGRAGAVTDVAAEVTCDACIAVAGDKDRLRRRATELEKKFGPVPR